MEKPSKKQSLDITVTQELERKIKENLTQTGLAQNIRVYYGSLRDPKNPPYLEFKLPKDNGNRRMNIRCQMLRNIILDLLVKNHPEIKGISYDFVYENAWRAKLVLNYEAEISDKDAFKTRVLSNLNKAIENYILRFGR